MRISATSQPVTEIQADAIVISLSLDSQGRPELSPTAQAVDQATDGLLTRLMDSGEIATHELAATRILGASGLRTQVLLVVSLGDKKRNAEALAFRAAGVAAKNIANKKRTKVVFALDIDPINEVVAGALVGCAGQDIYREQRKLYVFDELLIASDQIELIDDGTIVGEGVNLTRHLVNSPPNDIFPESFAEACVEQGNQCGFGVEVWDQERLERERCGALLAVAKGSARPPRLVIMRYQGAAAANTPSLALVGKGVTFDSGGLSLKPTDGMLDMKCDMAGAATVLGAMTAIARLKLPVNVIALVGLVENMVSGNCFRVGDVLVARSGRTIEVHNTDAEGRLVLADVLNVAISENVSHVIDLATLTGACMIALGRHVAGAMTNHPQWLDQVRQAADRCGEPLWELPMFPEYGELIRSSVADIKNVGDGRWGGAITAAKFLEEFVGQTPWVHLDIAGPAFQDKPWAWVDGGASGCFVRTLVQLTRTFAGGTDMA